MQETYHIDSTPELKTARSLMLWGIGIYIVGSILRIVSDNLSALIWLIGIVIGFIGLYRFSTLTQSPIFKYYFALFITPIVVVFVGGLFASGDIFTAMHDLLVLILALVYAIAYIYYARKMSYIMAYLTGNREFLTAWKTFKIAIIASFILGVIFGFSMVFGKYSVDSGGAFVFLLLIVALIIGVVYLISQIFVVMGVYKIYTKSRS
ncbi:hypothetical protein [uncultured Helicobacter sp.]|uniref:hypothetical protein n=1 Tax=uncultured Helicobacter sp. TaxID=175537 RepID=UPI00374F2E08